MAAQPPPLAAISPEADVDAPVIVPAKIVGRAAAGNGQYAVLYRNGRMAIVGADGQLMTPVTGLSLSGELPSAEALAFNGSYYLVVGAEPVDTGDDYMIGGDLYGLRVAPDGNLLDDAPFLLVGGNHHNESPSLASDGSGFLLTWTAHGAHGDGYDFAAALLAPDDAGLKLTELPPLLSGNPPSGLTQATYNGTNYVVAFDYNGVGSHLFHYSMLSTSGTLLVNNNPFLTPGAGSAVATYGRIVSGAAQTLLIADQAFLYDAAISPVGSGVALPGVGRSGGAHNGTNFQLAWSTLPNAQSGLSTVQIKSDGTAVSSSQQATPSFPAHGQLGFACGAGQCLTVADGLGTRLDKNGKALDDPALTLLGFARVQTDPVVVGGSDNYLVGWMETEPHFARMSLAGQTLDPNDVTVPGTGSASFTAISTSALDDTYFAAWFTSTPEADPDWLTLHLNLGRVSSAGVALDASPRVLDSQSVLYGDGQAAIACGTSNCLAVWEIDIGDSTNRVLAARFASDGTLLDTPPLQLDSGFSGGARVGAAWDGSQYLAAWSANTPARAKRISAAGAILDAAPIVIPGAPLSFSLAGNQGTFVVVNKSVPSVVRIDSAGTVLDSVPISIAPQGGLAATSPVADGFVVAWTDSQRDVNGVYLGRDGLKGCPFLIASDVAPGNTSVALGTDGKLLVAYPRFKPDVGYQSWRVLARTVELGSSNLQPDLGAGCEAGGGEGGVSSGGASGDGGVSSGAAGSGAAASGGTASGGTASGGTASGGGGAAGSAGATAGETGNGEGATTNGGGTGGESTSQGGDTSSAGESQGQPGDAGAPHAGTSGGGTPTGDHGGGGCSVTRSPSQQGLLGWATLCALIAVRRLRRRGT